MLDFKISAETEDDLIGIFEYGYYQFGSSQADKYYDLLFIYFDSIAKNPYSFEAVDHIKMGYRRCVCKTNSILYGVSETHVEIHAILGNQDVNMIL
jgi:toxin ParE1/3/4